MIKSNKNEKATDLIYSLNFLINKIENNIEIINEDDYTKLWGKVQELSYDGQSNVCLIFSNGMFDIINSYDQLYEDANYQDSLLIDIISRPFGCSNLEKIYQSMERQLYEIFFTEFGRSNLEDICLKYINSIINSTSISNLNALWYKEIPYSISNYEQKLFYLFYKNLEDNTKLINYITAHCLVKYNKHLELENFKRDIIFQISKDNKFNDKYTLKSLKVLFLEIEEENLSPHIYSFCNIFLKYKKEEKLKLIRSINKLNE